MRSSDISVALMVSVSNHEGVASDGTEKWKTCTRT
jgi:hypothetical protein